MTDQRRGTPDAPADHVARFGPELVHGLFTAGRTLRIHAMDNRATRASLRRLMDTIDDFSAAEGRVTVAVATDLLVVNDVRLMVEPQHMGPILFLVDEMKKRRVEEIDFAPDVDIEELGRFVQVFFSDPAEEDVFGALSSHMAAAGITRIRLTEWIERARHLRDTRTDKKHIREESNKAMARAVLFMGEVMRAIEQKHPVQIRKAHRLTQQMADIIKVDESVLVGLTSIKDYDEYTFAHSVNVSVLSMVIADHLGLPREQVAEIGVAGLLHDIGKTHIPLSILNKPGRLSPEEWDIMARHPMLGVIELTRGPIAALDRRPPLRDSRAPRPLRRRGVPAEAGRVGPAPSYPDRERRRRVRRHDHTPDVPREPGDTGKGAPLHPCHERQALRPARCPDVHPRHGRVPEWNRGRVGYRGDRRGGAPEPRGSAHASPLRRPDEGRRGGRRTREPGGARQGARSLRTDHRPLRERYRAGPRARAGCFITD